MAMTDTEYLITTARITVLRVDECISELGKEHTLSSFPTLEREVSKITADAFDEWMKIEAAKEDGSYRESAHSYAKALRVLGEDSVLQTLLDLCIAGYFFPEFSAYIKASFKFDTCIYLAAFLEGIEDISYSDGKRYADIARRLLVMDFKQENFLYTRVSADSRLIGFLSGDNAISSKLSDFTVMFSPEDYIHKPLVNQYIIDQGAAFFEGSGKILCLSGRGGRRFIAKHIAKKTGKKILLLNVAELICKDTKLDISMIRDTLIREAYISDAGICIYGFNNLLEDGVISDTKRLRRDKEMLAGIFVEPIIDEGIRIIFCIDDIKSLPEREKIKGARILNLPESYSFEEKKTLWKGIFDIYGINLNSVSFASRYCMTPREIASAALSFAEESVDVGNNIENETLFARLNLESTQNTNEKVGRIIYSEVKLEDVKLSSNVKMILTDTINAVFQSPVIMDEWKLRTIYPYGRCVSLLMAGPPGTGKTMSANAIAGELSLPLYQVNISKVVDKYIGETEKNLEKAFSFAEKNNVVLFFDEADALFGTRSEVHDSKDRYANNEVAYLLQRMESYNGIVLMATNLKGNIDPAFMRRIRYVAHFEKPDEEMRRQIWKSCFKDTVPSRDIDVDYLAAQFDNYTGSVIKAVFLNACALAAEDGELTMRHIIHAIKQEIEKEKTVGFVIDMLGKYAYLA